MRAFLRLNLLAILLALFANTLAVEAKLEEDKILKLMQSHRNKLTSIRSSARLVKYNSHLQESDNYEGELIYLFRRDQDPLIRADWTKPFREGLSIVNGNYLAYNMRLANKYSVGKLRDNKTALALQLITISEASIKQNFNLKYLGKESLNSEKLASHLELIPKYSSDVRLIELWIDEFGMPIQAKIVETNKDSTSVSLSNLQKNINISISMFKIQKGICSIINQNRICL